MTQDEVEKPKAGLTIMRKTRSLAQKRGLAS